MKVSLISPNVNLIQTYQAECTKLNFIQNDITTFSLCGKIRGDIIGYIPHEYDFIDENVLTKIVQEFENNSCHGVYGDFIRDSDNVVIHVPSISFDILKKYNMPDIMPIFVRKPIKFQHDTTVGKIIHQSLGNIIWHNIPETLFTYKNDTNG